MSLSASVQWDVRSGGSDTNGGAFDPSVTSPGTDYSQQTSAQIAFTDLVIGATTTQLTSVANPFTSAHVGNLINITSGSGFTTGWYTVTAVSTGIATMDRSVGSATSTGGHGALGGSMATPAGAYAAAASGNTIHIQTGTYGDLTLSSSLAICFRGYATSHNDGGSRPTLSDSGGGNCANISAGSYWFDNLIMTGANTHYTGIYGNEGTTVLLTNCKITGRDWAIYANNSGFYAVLFNCEITSCGNGSFPYGALYGTRFFLVSCWFHGNITDWQPANSTDVSFIAQACVFQGSSQHSLQAQNSSGSISVHGCVFRDTGTGGSYDAIYVGTSISALVVSNTVFYGISSGSGYAISGGEFVASFNNAFRNAAKYQTTAAANVLEIGPITLTADPFSNASGGDFTLDTTTGGGPLLEAAGYAVSLFGANYRDVGPLQHQDVGGGTIVLTQHITRIFQEA